MEPAEETKPAARGMSGRQWLTAGMLVGLVALVGVAALAARAAQTPATPAGAPVATAAALQNLPPPAPKGIPDQATIDRYMAIGKARYGANFMTPADEANPEMKRLATYYLMVDEELDRRRAAAGGGRRGQQVKMSFVEVEAFLGSEAYADQERLAAKVEAASKKP